MRVVGSDSGDVGTVDKVEGPAIVLIRDDPTSGHQHHSIAATWVAAVDDAVKLDRLASQARAEWQAVPRPANDPPARR